MTQLQQTALAEGPSEADGLRCALESRTVIAKAIGILMERHGTGDEQAFAYLVRLSQNQNVKLRLVAAGIVAETRHYYKPGGCE